MVEPVMKRLSLWTRNQTARANSFIRYAVSHAFTVFVVLWINLDASYAETGVDNYVHEGAIEAIDKVAEITGEEKVNAIGYCIGGTLLATALAFLAKGNRRPISNADLLHNTAGFRSAQRDHCQFGSVG